MSVVVPPSIEEIEKAQVHPAPRKGRTVLKVLGVVGVLAAVGLAGYFVGSSTANNNTSSAAAQPPTSTSAEAAAFDTVSAAFNDPNNVELVSKLTPGDLNELVDTYETQGYQQGTFSLELIQALQTLRNSFRAQNTNTRSLREADRKASYRSLIGAYDIPFANAAWEMIEDETYSNAIASGDDRVVVKKSGGYCWIISQESNSAADWLSNLNLGSTDIQSINTYSVAAEACGCAKTTLWWCSTYKTCNTYKTLAKGYSGFVKPANAMRLQVWSAIQSTCASSDIKAFIGYSRGGAISTAFAFMVRTENLVPASQLRLVTFGSPRVLEKAPSDSFQDAISAQWRFVNKDDMVPSIPYNWMGYKHVGNMRCNQCNYDEARDAPSWSWNGGDHTGYCQFWGDQAC